MAKTPTWQRKAGQNPNGGLNEAGRRSLKAAGHDIKRPQPEGGSRRDSFCARMKGMKAKLTSSETANDPDSRINKSLRAWNCHADGGPVWEKDRPKGLGKPQKLTPSEKRSAKASAKAAGRPYPNLVDNMRAARADGGALKAALELAAKAGRNLMSHEDILKRVPELQDLAKRGDFSNWQQAVDKYKPVAPWTTVPEPASYEQMLDALHASKKAHLGLGSDIPEGRRVGLRLDIPSYVEKGVWVPTIHEAGTSGKKLAHEAVARVKNATFDFPQSNALKVAQGSGKSPFAKIEGDWTPSSTQEALEIANRYLNHPDWAQIGMDPERHAYFYDRVTQEPIKSAEDVVQVGPFVLGKNPTYGKRSDYKYAEGGDVRPELGAGGDAVKAALKAAQDVIRAYHASASKFEKFDNSKIGSGVGAQAYGQGHYLASSDPVARGYLGPSAQYDRMSGAMSPKEEFAFDIATNASDPTTWTIIKPLVEKYGQNISYDEAEKLAEDAIRKRGHMYEVGIHARPEHFLDWDKRLAEQSPFVQQKLTPESLKLLPGGPGGPFNGRRAWVDETGLPLGRATTASEPPSSVFQDSEIAPSIYRQLGRDNPAASTDKLRAAGIAGIKYLDPSYRHLGEGARNYVVFNPDILEIMRRYSRGGMTRHGYATDGSVEGDVSFLDTPDFEDSGSIMAKLAPSKPQKTPSEFIKQELAYGDKQLPQYDPEAGKETGLRALEMAKMAGYLTPASPYIAAGDFAQQMLSGEPMGAAIASAFLPGGKYAKMAGAALASQAGPEEAEAGLLTPKMFRDLYQYALAHPQHADPFLRSEAFKAITSMQTPLTGKIAQPGHIYGLSHDIAPLDVVSTIRKMRGVDLLPRRQKSWLDLYNEGKGGTFIGLGGDRSRLGRMTEINGQKLGWPVDWHAGPEYMLEPNPGSVWANAEDASSTLNNQILRASRNGTRPVFGAYMPMGAQSLDSSVQMIDSILSLMHGRGKLEPKVAEEFDNMLRSGSFYPKDQESLIEKARTKFKDWPGINNPKAASDFIKKRARDADESLRVTGTDRGALVKAIDSASWNEKGFPNVGEIRVAGTNPDLLATPNNMVGYRIVQLDPDQAARSLEAASKKKFGHNTYTSDLHGSYWGDVELAPRDLAMPDSAIKILNKRKVAMQNPYGPKKPRKLGERDPETGLFPGALDKSKPFRIDHPMSPDFRGRQAFRKVSEQARKQPITQRWFDTLSEGQQRLLKEGYERGGKVEDALRLANKILSKG